MGSSYCNKYFDKADGYQNDIDDLNDRIGDLNSVPHNDHTARRIAELRREVKLLESKKEAALQAGYDCVSNHH